jgi:chromosome partitioning protein
MTTVITVACQKGGVGKTTTAVTLAHGLAIAGYPTLLVDLDPQGQCSPALGQPQRNGVFDWLINGPNTTNVEEPSRREHLYLLPGNQRTLTAQVVMQTEGTVLGSIRRGLADCERDFVVIDTSPSVGGFQEAALYAADWVVIPVACDMLSAEAAGQTLQMLVALHERGWQGVLLGILPTFYDDTTRESKAILDELNKLYGHYVLRPIHRATILRECVAVGKTIWELAPSSRSAAEYSRLVWRVSDGTT